MNSRIAEPSWISLLAGLRTRNVTWGENTWNQGISNGSGHHSPGGVGGYIVRLHLGSAISREQHTTVLLYLQDPTDQNRRAEMARVLRGLSVRDRKNAVVLLGDAVATNTGQLWEFIVNSDTNDTGSVYRMDIATEAPLAPEEVIKVQRYLDARQPEGRPILQRIFLEERRDFAAAEVLDLQLRP